VANLVLYQELLKTIPDNCIINIDDTKKTITILPPIDSCFTENEIEKISQFINGIPGEIKCKDKIVLGFINEGEITLARCLINRQRFPSLSFSSR